MSSNQIDVIGSDGFTATPVSAANPLPVKLAADVAIDVGTVDQGLAGPAAWLVTMSTLLAGEDLTNSVLGVISKPIVGATYSWSVDVSLGAKVSSAPKGSAALIHSARITNINAAVRYFHVFNKTSVPVLNDVPIYSEPILSGVAVTPGSLILGADFFGPNGSYLSTGLAWGISSTQATYTAATASDHSVTVHYQ